MTTERLAAAVFQQAKKSSGEPQFLQIEAKEGSATPRKSKPKAEPKLTRVAFKVSRLMEFCTLRELQNQTGHPYDDWALVVLRELMDNALDACEEAEVAPVISIDVRDGSITIQDNAGGFDPATVESILDYTVRVSSREAYCSPTRGAQGNALKTILAMAFVLLRNSSASRRSTAKASQSCWRRCANILSRLHLSISASSALSISSRAF